MVANRLNTLTEELIENLAVEIREFLLAEEMWQDVTIYFNGKAFSTYDKVNGKYYYNDREHLVVQEDEDPERYFISIHVPTKGTTAILHNCISIFHAIST